MGASAAFPGSDTECCKPAGTGAPLTHLTNPVFGCLEPTWNLQPSVRCLLLQKQPKSSFKNDAQLTAVVKGAALSEDTSYTGKKDFVNPSLQADVKYKSEQVFLHICLNWQYAQYMVSTEHKCTDDNYI